jgi:hypothetical protein
MITYLLIILMILFISLTAFSESLAFSCQLSAFSPQTCKILFHVFSKKKYKRLIAASWWLKAK